MSRSAGIARPVSLVTGAGRGIGRGIAIELAKLGHALAVNYVGNAAAAEECLHLVKEAGGDGTTIRADVSSAEDREQLLKEVIDRYGRIDMLVNNAGVAPNVRDDLLEAGEESFDRLINTNLKGPYFLTQRVARQMIRQIQEGSASEPGPPRIVNVTSISAYVASVNRGDYCVSKAGLAMMTKLFAARLAEFGICVYEVRPGVIATDMTGGVKEKYDKLIEQGAWPIRRWGEAEDVGRAVAAIARGDFPFSTGEVINIDGGFHLRTL
ncbi:MAG TPA: 3-ketoacyl-ACP reductase [Pyrinomonadaceae bacterium]|nr:3-ketoacyl-ACP reductase [Pyrinomonadaceae bacterium]